MPKQLTYKERCQIEGYLQVGNSKSAIAKQLKRAVSTIHDEIKRNQCTDGIYRADEAAALSLARKQAQRTLPRKIPPDLWLRIESLLGDEWSPEQISGWLQLNEGIKVSHEWIYQHIWKDKTQGGSLYEHLRNQGKRYQKRGADGKTKRGSIRNRVGIEQRPSIVDERSRVGDWEIDTIIGKSHKGAIVSIIERKTRYTCLVKVGTKSAPAVTAASFKRLRPLAKVLQTITADNGKEFAWHEHFTNALGVEFFFARPYHSWERGTNENTNGLVRQYLPKKTDFTQVSDCQVKAIEDKLNNRPRKCLGYKTPNQMMALALAA